MQETLEIFGETKGKSTSARQHWTFHDKRLLYMRSIPMILTSNEKEKGIGACAAFHICFARSVPP